MKEPTLKRNFIANILVSIFTILIPSLFIFFTIREGLMRSFANEVLNEMSAIDLVEKRHRGERFDEEMHQLDYIKRLPESERDQEALRTRFNEISFMFILLPLLLILILIFVRGWANVKSKVKQVDASKVGHLVPPVKGIEKVKWYVSRHTFSYGFLIKRVVLGSDFFFSSDEKKEFMLYHELRHLTFRDSILKNFLINIRKFFLPIFFLFLWFFTFLYSVFQILFPYMDMEEEPDLATQQIIAIVSYAIMPVIMIFLIRASFRKVTKWFAHVKEFLADQYAMIRSNGYIPELKQVEGKYHPSGERRMLFLQQHKRSISAFPYFFFSIIMLNVNFGDGTITNEYYFLVVFLLFLICVLTDIFYLRLHEMRLKEWVVLLLLILFLGAWNYLALEFHTENNTFGFSPTSYILNLLFNAGLAMVLIVYGFAQFLIRKAEK